MDVAARLGDLYSDKRTEFMETLKQPVQERYLFRNTVIISALGRALLQNLKNETTLPL